MHLEDLREAGSIAGAIDVDLTSLGQIYFFAARAENFEARCFQGVAESDWQYFLPIAEGSRTRPKDSIQKLLVHLGEPAR